MNILIAEDDFVARRILQKMLETLGHQVIACENGLKAWEAIRNNAARLAIIDWMMPIIDGLTLCRKIREEKLPEYVYIILLTSNDQKSDIVEGLNAGADDYMTKPYDPFELKARIRSGQRVLKLEDDLKTTTSQLLHSEKLAALGTLAAGIAHEINTPMQYLQYNTLFLQESFEGIVTLLKAYGGLERRVAGGGAVRPLLQEIRELEDRIDLPYLLQEIPRAVGESSEGVAQVTEIVQSMRDFTHPGNRQIAPMDVNAAISNTVRVTRNQWSQVADIDLDLDPDLPVLPCVQGEFNQVVLNLLVNAAHAIEERLDKDPDAGPGRISITTRRAEAHAEIRIRDNGTGIPDLIRPKVFDPFFTTKEVGRGTGQGLAISRSVIVDRLGGRLTFDTRVGEGTTFIIRLPLEQTAHRVP